MKRSGRAAAPLGITHICCFVLLSAFFQACLPKGQSLAGGNFVWVIPFISVQTLGLAMKSLVISANSLISQ